jgi:hypothetical protein
VTPSVRPHLLIDDLVNEQHRHDNQTFSKASQSIDDCRLERMIKQVGTPRYLDTAVASESVTGSVQVLALAAG